MFKEKIDAINASIVEKQSEAQAFVKLAESEDRELTEEESNSIDEILNTDLPKLKSELERFEKLVAFSVDVDRSSDDPSSDAGSVDGNPKKIVVPAAAKRHAKLKAFQGANAEEDAYTAGKWLLATIGGHNESAEWCADHGISTQYAGMVTNDNQLGGYTVPTEMEVSVIALREQYGVFRRNAHVETLSADVKTISRPTGGITAAFVGEGKTTTTSNSNWKQIELVARKLMALSKMSKELSVDSVVSVADQVARDVAQAFALKEDQCGFLGDATSGYGSITGLLNKLLASSKYTALSGNTAFSSLDLVDFETMVGQLPQYAENGAKWYISKKGYYASMARLMDAAGGNTNANLSEGAKPRFLGFDVELVQVMNSTLSAQTSTDGLCYFGNLAMAATLADRTGMSLETSDQVYFTTDEIAIKGTERFGINIHEYGAATGDAGPIIGLSTPGS